MAKLCLGQHAELLQKLGGDDEHLLIRRLDDEVLVLVLFWRVSGSLSPWNWCSIPYLSVSFSQQCSSMLLEVLFRRFDVEPKGPWRAPYSNPFGPFRQSCQQPNNEGGEAHGKPGYYFNRHAGWLVGNGTWTMQTTIRKGPEKQSERLVHDQSRQNQT
jgi:hypothetical protein